MLQYLFIIRSRNSYRGDAFQSYRDLPLNHSDPIDFNDDSSLGILDNMSSRSGELFFFFFHTIYFLFHSS